MTFRYLSVCLLSLIGGALSADAQTFPTKPVSLVVPFAAGGPSDSVARVVADHMGRTLGQQVIVENIAGAGGTTGAERVAKAEPDGHTLLIHHSGLATAPSLYSNLRFDPRTAFQPIGLINVGPMVVIARKSLAVSSLTQLIDWAKANADKANFAHAGIGSSSHICLLMLQQVAGTKFNAVAYRGTGPAMNDLIAGTIDIICDQATNAVPQIIGGTVRAHAILATERSQSLPDVPTAVEGGFPSLRMVQYHGIYAPKGTPAVVVDQLNEAVRRAVGDAAVIARFNAVGTSAFPATQLTPAAHAEFFAADIAAQAKAFAGGGLPAIEAK